MQISLDTKEALFIANALKVYAGDRLEHARGMEATEAEKAGRKLCAHFLESIENEMELENAFDEARDAFCGIGNDSDL